MKLTNNLSIESLIEMYEKQGFGYQQMTQIKKGLIIHEYTANFT